MVTTTLKNSVFAQFMFRVSLELPKKTYLGMFSTLKYVNAPDSVEYRNKYFNHKYEKGFLFHSKCFQGINGNFPIAFMIWNLSKKSESKTIEIDIANDSAINIGVKNLRLIEKKDVINNWFERPKNSNDYILPPLSNGIKVKDSNTDSRHRARPDFLASICSKGNDFQNSKYVVILSSPSVSAGAFTVNQSNFKQAVTLHAVRKIPKSTWLNDRNQFLIPHTEPTQNFYNDCIIWSLFSSSNQTTSLSNIEYLGENYNITNNFYPFLISDIKKWKIEDPDFRQQLSVDEDRFVANWINENELSEEAKKVLLKAKKVYEIFYSHSNSMVTQNWKIETWDAGWYQIRRCLNEHNLGEEEINALKVESDILANKILPQLEEFGFLDKDEVYEKI